MNSQRVHILALMAVSAAFGSPLALAQVGANYCGPAAPNSSGHAATISALGSADLGINANRLTLVAEGLPTNQFGLFLVSRAQGFTPNPGGSVGNLCLGGSIGRNAAVGQVLNAGVASRMELAIDLALIPQGAGVVQVLAGDTWNYQAWFRDVTASGAQTSNFSDAVEVQFSDSCPTCTTVPGMVPIPAGTFRMGSDAPNAAPYFNNPIIQPIRDVTITYSFWMGQYEVTQAEYEAVMGSNPALFVGPSRPVEVVNWFQARAYCAALTAQNAADLPVGYEYRLPTEAEWEYACRAGTTTEYHYGPELFCNESWFAFSHHSNSSCGVPSGTTDVGQFLPNAYGLYDMHGNVWEWCLDAWGVYSGQAVTDPFVTGSIYRVVRGGSWLAPSNFNRSASRFIGNQGVASYTAGFRVVLAPVLVP